MTLFHDMKLVNKLSACAPMGNARLVPVVSAHEGPSSESSNTCFYGCPRHVPTYPFLLKADMLTKGIAPERLIELLFCAGE